jgi:hypothetical protein
VACGRRNPGRRGVSSPSAAKPHRASLCEADLRDSRSALRRVLAAKNAAPGGEGGQKSEVAPFPPAVSEAVLSAPTMQGGEGANATPRDAADTPRAVLPLARDRAALTARAKRGHCLL